MTLLIDDRENDRVAHKILMRLGDANQSEDGQAKLVRLNVGDYVYGSWGIEAKEINDLYGSIIGKGRSRTVNAQLSDLADNFETPIIVVYGNKWKPFVKGKKPSRKDLAIQIGRMEKTVKSWKQSFMLRHPKVRFMQLETENEFVEWIVANYTQVRNARAIGSQPIGVKALPANTDPRILALASLPGVNSVIAEKILERFGSIPNLLKGGVNQKDLMEITGINRNKARKILALRDKWSDNHLGGND